MNSIKKTLTKIIITLLTMNIITVTTMGGIAIYYAAPENKSAVALELVDKLNFIDQIASIVTTLLGL